MWLICYLFFSSYAGNCGSSRSITPIQDQIEEKEEFAHIKRKHIEETVLKIPLPKIAILHRKCKSVDYSKYNIDVDDCRYFRECVKQRYEDNEEEIYQMLQDTANRYRQNVYSAHVHAINLRRARRMTLPVELPTARVEVSRSRSSVSLD